jgi:hypothetical protein
MGEAVNARLEDERVEKDNARESLAAYLKLMVERRIGIFRRSKKMTQAATRASDHDTSRKAAEKIKLDINETQWQVYTVIRLYAGGMTDTELRKVCDVRWGKRAESTWRKRRKELLEKKLVFETPARRLNDNGSEEKVWLAIDHRSEDIA